MIIKEEIRGETEILCSEESKVLSGGIQGNVPVIWIDEPGIDRPKTHIRHIPRVFDLLVTGVSPNREYDHIATFQDGWFVGHIVEYK